MDSVRILIADDHAIIRRGLRALLAREPGFEIVAEAADGMEAVKLAEEALPHVAILDISMPNLNGFEAARRISASLPDVRVVMLTVHNDDHYLWSALKAGATGYVLKSSAEFEVVEATRAVSQGKAYFSPRVSRMLQDEYLRYSQQNQTDDEYELLTGRERQILQLLAEGQGNKDIATLLDLSTTTVICHRQHILQKLNLHGLADLVLYAIRKGVIAPEAGAPRGA